MTSKVVDAVAAVKTQIDSHRALLVTNITTGTAARKVARQADVILVDGVGTRNEAVEKLRSALGL